MKHTTNNVMEGRRREDRKDKLYSLLNAFFWMIVLAVIGSLIVVYAVDTFVPYP